METKKGYKASNNGWCKNVFYEVGKTYTHDDEVILCQSGFHYCTDIDDVFLHYIYTKGVTKIFEIEDLGDTATDYTKNVTNKIRIVREIPVSEWNTIAKRHVFDEHGNLEKWIGHSGLLSETYKYDEKDRLVRIDESNGKWKTFEYDNQNNMVRCDESTGFWEAWTYKEHGNVDTYKFGREYDKLIS